LLTLTGPGGAGKTRLGLQVAAEMVGEFADGVSLVELAPLRDPHLVGATIAHVLGVRETGDQPLVICAGSGFSRCRRSPCLRWGQPRRTP
jgi:predicted ATPase